MEDLATVSSDSGGIRKNIYLTLGPGARQGADYERLRKIAFDISGLQLLLDLIHKHGEEDLESRFPRMVFTKTMEISNGADKVL